MRSSKSRSRSKSNRQRTIGNIVNRVFDSSGPEGKVRGTPQQIIEKYLMLARDAQLSNDRVAAEAFLQHAEHYTRMLAEAQRELQREQEQRQGNQNYGGQGYGGQNGNGQNGNGQNGNGQQGDRRDQNRDYGQRDMRSDDDQPELLNDAPEVEEADTSGLHRFVSALTVEDRDDDNGLVDTPEQPLQRESAAPRREDRPRRDDKPREAKPRGDQNRENSQPRSRKPRPEGEAAPAAADSTTDAPREDRPRRAPRKPRAEATPVAEGGDTPAVSE